jgi:ATP-dependent exoDNAse (exonuclease V) beta subunit
VGLTPSQLDAVDITKATQDACVTAGPGSGKTLVLVELFRRLVMEAGVPPSRMLAITFTEKAARNMKERLAAAFRELPESRRELEQANVSTVHGFCARLLRENAVLAGIDPEFHVLDARQSTVMQRQAAVDALDQNFEAKPDAMRSLMGALGSPDIASMLPSVYDAMRAAGISPAQLSHFKPRGVIGREEFREIVRPIPDEEMAGWEPPQVERFREFARAIFRIVDLPRGPITHEHLRAVDEFPTNLNPLKRSTPAYALLKRIKDEAVPQLKRSLITDFYQAQRETLFMILHSFDQIYSERKRRMSALDYADLEWFAVRLLEDNSDLRERVRSGFRHVLMDEFQDTNGQQSRLLELVRGQDRFYAVGDINQAIYGFRHGDPEVFRAYRDSVEQTHKHLVELTENWRSRPDILRTVETIFSAAPGIEHRPLRAARNFPEKLEPSIEVLTALADDPQQALELEARLVARRILEISARFELTDHTASFGDIAVLVRNSEVLPVFTRVFEAAGIPYLLNQSKGFFETREIVDLTHLLRVIANPRDEISMAAVLRSPLVEASDESLLRLKQVGNLGAALRHVDAQALLAPEEFEKLTRFSEQMRRWRADRDLIGFDRLLVKAMEETGYTPDPGTRAASNVERFLALAREASSRLTLAEFVDELDLMRDAEARDADPPPEDSVNAVRIMTVHAAKGLEFPIVFLAALHKGVRQDVPPLCFSPRVGLGARWRNPAGDDDKGDWFHAAIRDEAGRREIEEGNRLFYVAMTRAEEHLVFSLSSTGSLKNWAATLANGLSVDLAIPQNKVQSFEAPDGSRFAVRLLSTNITPAPLSPPTRVSAAAAVQSIARPKVDAQYDSTASVTSVALFAHCPRRYYLERYLGWQGGRARVWTRDDEDHRDDLDASEFGLEVHALLAGQRVVNVAPEALKLAEIFRISELGRRSTRAQRAEREFDFLLALEDVVLRGQIDLWFEEGGELIVVDYKTDDVTAAEVPARAELYAPQLRLYAVALEHVLGRHPDRAYVFMLRAGIAVPINLEPTLLDDPAQLVRDFRDAQSNLTFPLHEGRHCRECPYYRGLCPAGSGVAQVIHPAAIDSQNLAGDETRVR